MTGLHYPSIVGVAADFQRVCPAFPRTRQQLHCSMDECVPAMKDGRMTNPSPFEFAIDVTNRSYAQRTGRPVPTQRQLCEHYSEDCTRAAEHTDDVVFRKMLLMLALQWKLAEREETAKLSEAR